MSLIEEKRAQRLQFMNALYDVVDGFEGEFADMAAFLCNLDLDLDKEEDFNKFQSIARYLKGEGLIEPRAVESGTIVIGVSLTHKGVREVEEARSEPDQPTEHFAPINVVYAGTITNSPIQQGSPGATQSLHILEQNNLQQLKAFLQSLKESVDHLGLSNDERAEIEADIQTVEVQITSPKPKQEVVKPGLSSIRRILEGSASAAIASPLTATVTSIINNL